MIGADYQLRTVVTKDGRNLTGLIVENNEQRVVMRMAGDSQETVPRNNVEYIRVSKLHDALGRRECFQHASRVLPL